MAAQLRAMPPLPRRGAVRLVPAMQPYRLDWPMHPRDDTDEEKVEGSRLLNLFEGVSARVHTRGGLRDARLRDLIRDSIRRRRPRNIFASCSLDLLDGQTRGQGLLELVRLVGVVDAQRVQVLRAPHLELGARPGLLDLDAARILTARRQEEILDLVDLLRLLLDEQTKGRHEGGSGPVRGTKSSFERATEARARAVLEGDA